jgi:hypothetical protein
MGVLSYILPLAIGSKMPRGLPKGEKGKKQVLMPRLAVLNRFTDVEGEGTSYFWLKSLVNEGLQIGEST